HDFDFVALKALCKSISSWVSVPIPDRKPIVGEKVYTHESGIHVDGILKEPATYEVFSPELLGRYRQFVPGKHSGRKAIRHLAEEMGFDVSRMNRLINS
ncbi:hypothetical protein HGB07_09415, partial [Candidatus Roizmanbacteria bacterium]|nr:hypothetical protein [Candidatus Roizmanbacteria bacterium]